MKCISDISIGYRDNGRTKYHTPGTVFNMERKHARPWIKLGMMRKASAADIAAAAGEDLADDGAPADELVEVAEAIRGLNPETDFNARGKADLAALSEAVGRKVSGDERDAAAALLAADDDNDSDDDDNDSDDDDNDDGDNDNGGGAGGLGV